MSIVTSRPCDTAQLGVYLMEFVGEFKLETQRGAENKDIAAGIR